MTNYLVEMETIILLVVMEMTNYLVEMETIRLLVVMETIPFISTQALATIPL